MPVPRLAIRRLGASACKYRRCRTSFRPPDTQAMIARGTGGCRAWCGCGSKAGRDALPAFDGRDRPAPAQAQLRPLRRGADQRAAHRRELPRLSHFGFVHEGGSATARMTAHRRLPGRVHATRPARHRLQGLAAAVQPPSPPRQRRSSTPTRCTAPYTAVLTKLAAGGRTATAKSIASLHLPDRAGAQPRVVPHGPHRLRFAPTKRCAPSSTRSSCRTSRCSSRSARSACRLTRAPNCTPRPTASSRLPPLPAQVRGITFGVC